MNTLLSGPQSYTSFIASEIEPYVLGTSNLDKSAVISLTGDLGAGKSTFTREISKHIGIKEKIVSPTFLLMKEYPIDPAVWGKTRLVHVDAYRVNHSDELILLGFLDVLKDNEALTIIEWAERISDIIPGHALWYRLEVAGDKQRVIEKIEA